MNLRQAPCGYKSLRHRVAHALGAQSHTKCWRSLGEMAAKGFAEGLRQAEEAKRTEQSSKGDD